METAIQEGGLGFRSFNKTAIWLIINGMIVERTKIPVGNYFNVYTLLFLFLRILKKGVDHICIRS